MPPHRIILHRFGGLVLAATSLVACASVLGLERGEPADLLGADATVDTIEGNVGDAATDGDALVPASDYAELVLAAEPLAYYPLEETAGASTVRNRAPLATPRERDGNVVGATLGLPGARGGTDLAMVSAGLEARVDLTWQGIPAGNEPFTIEFAVRPDAIDDTTRVLFSHPDSLSGAFYGYRFVAQGSGIRFERVATDGTDVLRADDALVKDRWLHLAASYDGGRLRLFANGKTVDEMRTARRLVATGSRACFGSASVDEPPFNGRLDELAIYSREVPDDLLAGHAARLVAQ